MTERLIHTQRETRCWWRYYVATTADANSTECVSQQELAAVKAEMESKVDKLHSQINYWQGVTVNNIFQDHCKTGYTVTTWLSYSELCALIDKYRLSQLFHLSGALKTRVVCGINTPFVHDYSHYVLMFGSS